MTTLAKNTTVSGEESAYDSLTFLAGATYPGTIPEWAARKMFNDELWVGGVAPYDPPVVDEGGGGGGGLSTEDVQALIDTAVGGIDIPAPRYREYVGAGAIASSPFYTLDTPDHPPYSVDSYGPRLGMDGINGSQSIIFFGDGLDIHTVLASFFPPENVEAIDITLVWNHEEFGGGDIFWKLELAAAVGNYGLLGADGGAIQTVFDGVVTVPPVTNAETSFIRYSKLGQAYPIVGGSAFTLHITHDETNPADGSTQPPYLFGVLIEEAA